jgi:hypothetical protein
LEANSSFLRDVELRHGDGDPNTPWAYVEKDERGKILARAATRKQELRANLEYSILERVPSLFGSGNE